MTAIKKLVFTAVSLAAFLAATLLTDPACFAQLGGQRSTFPGVRGGSNYYRGWYDFSRTPFYFGYGSRQYGGSYYGGGYYQNGLGLSLSMPLTRYGSTFSSQPNFSGVNQYRSYTSGYGAYYGNDPPPSYALQASPLGEDAVISTSPGAAGYQLQAERAFRDHQYADAARLANHAIVEDGRNGKLYLFAAQALFALGDYQGAAATIHHAASLLDRKEWGYVVENYTKFYRGRDYVTQMEKLVEFIKKHPDAAYAHFLRGYQYVYLGYDEPARQQLAKALELEGRDELAADLLKQVGGTVPESAEAGESAPPKAEKRPSSK